MTLFENKEFFEKRIEWWKDVYGWVGCSFFLLVPFIPRPLQSSLQVELFPIQKMLSKKHNVVILCYFHTLTLCRFDMTAMQFLPMKEISEPVVNVFNSKTMASKAVLVKVGYDAKRLGFRFQNCDNVALLFGKYFPFFYHHVVIRHHQHEGWRYWLPRGGEIESSGLYSFILHVCMETVTSRRDGA